MRHPVTLVIALIFGVCFSPSSLAVTNDISSIRLSLPKTDVTGQKPPALRMNPESLHKAVPTRENNSNSSIKYSLQVLKPDQGTNYCLRLIAPAAGTNYFIHKLP